jgi:hypothetical protein
MSPFGQNKAEAAVIDNKPFTCTVCGHGLFFRRRAQMNSAVTINVNRK